MAEQENSKDLISVLWSGADILRSKMDANEYYNSSPAQVRITPKY